MVFNNPKNLEERILFYLQNNSCRVSDLIVEIKKNRPNTTKQGVYASLRALRKNEIVVLHGGFVSLNTVWLDKIKIRAFPRSFAALPLLCKMLG